MSQQQKNVPGPLQLTGVRATCGASGTGSWDISGRPCGSPSDSRGNGQALALLGGTRPRGRGREETRPGGRRRAEHVKPERDPSRPG